MSIMRILGQEDKFVFESYKRNTYFTLLEGWGRTLVNKLNC